MPKTYVILFADAHYLLEYLDVSDKNYILFSTINVCVLE